MYPHDYDPMAPVREVSDRVGIREETVGVRENFTLTIGKRYEAIGKEIGDLTASVHELRHKLLGPSKEVARGTPDKPEPGGDVGVLENIERSNERIYRDVQALAHHMRDLLNRI